MMGRRELSAINKSATTGIITESSNDDLLYLHQKMNVKSCWFRKRSTPSPSKRLCLILTQYYISEDQPLEARQNIMVWGMKGGILTNWCTYPGFLCRSGVWSLLYDSDTEILTWVEWRFFWKENTEWLACCPSHFRYSRETNMGKS